MSKFNYLLQRDIYDVLIGDTVLTPDGFLETFTMPYCTGSELISICAKFGLSEAVGKSRWMYMEALLKHTVNKGTIERLLLFFFDYARFRDTLSGSASSAEMKSKYEYIVSRAIDEININLVFDEKKLVKAKNSFCIQNIHETTIIDCDTISNIDLEYIYSLRERIAQDLQNGQFDSVLSKARTLAEEVLIFILEAKNENNIPRGDYVELSKKIKNYLGMQQSKEFDKRVNAMLSGLEKTIQAVIEMRNSQGDAHGHGSRRIAIRKHEALLVVNATITYLEYIFSVYLSQTN